MKPLKAMELSAPMDLSEYSFDSAQDILRSVEKSNRTHYSLRIPSQLMGVAITMRVHRQFLIDIDFNYHSDEWSLHAADYSGDEFTDQCVWSPGA